jgi:hypothetical protein
MRNFQAKFQLENSVKMLKNKFKNEKRTNSSYPKFMSNCSAKKVTIESSDKQSAGAGLKFDMVNSATRYLWTPPNLQGKFQHQP